MGNGTEPPVAEDRAGELIAVHRSFAFVDVTGFTAYCDRHGEHAAIDLLTRFRTHVRDIAGRRGVRVAKWLGDGVMLVATEEAPLVAVTAELVVRCEAIGIQTHAGISTGTALLFEGDDYVGQPANLAARLCEVAAPGQILACGLEEPLPDWVEDHGPREVWVTGIGDLSGVADLAIVAPLAEAIRAAGAAV